MVTAVFVPPGTAPATERFSRPEQMAEFEPRSQIERIQGPFVASGEGAALHLALLDRHLHPRIDVVRTGSAYVSGDAAPMMVKTPRGRSLPSCSLREKFSKVYL